MTTSERHDLGAALQTTLVEFSRDGRRYVTDEGISSQFEGPRFQVELCQPNLELLEFLGGEVTADDWSPGSDARPVDVSVWSARIKQGSVVGYYRWDCTCDRGLSFDGVRLEGQEIGSIRLGGHVQNGTFRLHVEDNLPSGTTRGFTS